MTIKTKSTDTLAAPRAMFHSSTSSNQMLRGPMVAYEPDGNEGGKSADELAAEVAAAEAAAAAEAEAARLAAEEADKDKDKKAKPSDAEAKLLKDVMKHKEAATAAKAAADAAAAALKAFEGIDPEEYRKLKEAASSAERTELEKRGEYDRILAQVNEQHESAITTERGKTASVEAELAAARTQIDELTIGTAFGNSKFLSTETVLSPAKARVLYGAHFEQVDGKTVGYDKPKGVADRTPLVDSAGVNLSFEAAIEKIVKADEDFESFAKSKLKPGSNSQGSQHKAEDDAPKPVQSGMGRIAANLGKLKPTDPKAK